MSYLIIGAGSVAVGGIMVRKTFLEFTVDLQVLAAATCKLFLKNLTWISLATFQFMNVSAKLSKRFTIMCLKNVG